MDSKVIFSEPCFTVGSLVKFVPANVYGDTTHPDCKDGIVRYINENGKITVDYGSSVRNTSIEDLVIVYPRGL